VTIASGIISGFSLSVVIFKFNLNCNKGIAGVYPSLLETTLIPDIYTMVRSSFGPNELSFVAVKTCRCLGQLQVYMLAKFKFVFLFTFNLLSWYRYITSTFWFALEWFPLYHYLKKYCVKNHLLTDKKPFSSIYICLTVFNVTINNISVISWRSVLLLEETGGPGENHRAVTFINLSPMTMPL
jgi:hypothetical protein